jgi:hypothetical protein
MVYNRYGYALLGLVMLEAFQPAGGSKRTTEEWVGGISSGAATALALFLKASFSLVAFAFLAASFLFWRPARRRLLGWQSGFRWSRSRSWPTSASMSGPFSVTCR